MTTLPSISTEMKINQYKQTLYIRTIQYEYWSETTLKQKCINSSNSTNTDRAHPFPLCKGITGKVERGKEGEVSPGGSDLPRSNTRIKLQVLLKTQSLNMVANISCSFF